MSMNMNTNRRSDWTIGIGMYLLKKREELRGSTFAAWLKGSNLGITPSEAARYINVARQEAIPSDSTEETWTSAHIESNEVVEQLADFTSTLARALKAELTDLNEPVFPNPKTGKDASSIFAIMRVLRYFYRPHWSELVAIVNTVAGDAAFTRRDLPKTSSTYPTICLDLEAVERVLAEVQPRKAPKLIQAFKDRHGITK